MKKRVGIFLMIVSIALTAFTCEEDKDENSDYNESLSYVIETSLPETGKVNQEITFNVTHAGNSGCASYSRQETTSAGKHRFVTFYQRTPKDAFCTMNIIFIETPYVFKPTMTGEYTFHFNQHDGELIQTILVTE